MNRVSKALVVVVLLLLMVAPLVGAQEQNIVEIAVNDGRFDTLVAAVVAAGLDGALSGGEWTVFAPTDEAFAKLGLNASNIASAMSRDELTDILLYHVLPANVSSAEAKGLLGDVTMANGKIAGLKYFDGSLWVNDDARVIIQDIAASNGTIHVVDNVILPPWPRVEETVATETPAENAVAGVESMEAPVEPAATTDSGAETMTEAEQPSTIPSNSIAGIALNDGRFDTLVAAVVAADLVDALSGGEWTVFAPTDDAFAKLGLDASNIASTFSKEELTDILLYHVLPVSVSSAEAKTLLGDITMANGKLAGLKYFDDSLWINDDSRVIIENIIADNGTIHVVDNVILGPWPRD
ncbi:MAG: fasciclin domain-containing protein [Candidatus Promineifilaceae bacterium]